MRYSGPAVILFALVSACAESGTEPEPTSSLEHGGTTTVQILEPGQYPDEVPPELRVPAVLHSVNVDAGWSPDGFAYSGAKVEYTATSAYVQSRVVTDVGTSPLATKRANHLVPIRGSVQTPVPSVPMPKCTGTIRGEGLGRVWNEFVGSTVLRWGEQEESATAAHSCPRPRTTTTTIPDDDGGGDSAGTCYLVEIDHYWYYPDTGELEFRYTEAYRWCEKGGPAYM